MNACFLCPFSVALGGKQFKILKSVAIVSSTFALLSFWFWIVPTLTALICFQAGEVPVMIVPGYSKNPEVLKSSPEKLPSPRMVPVSSARSEEHTSELQSRPQLVCRLLLE